MKSLIILILSSTFAFAQNKKVQVFILAGQSNATGQGYMANLSSGQIIQSEVMLFHSGAPHLNGKGAANEWHQLMQASESLDRFGPELGLGYRLYQLIGNESQIAIIKHAHSGTNLASQWYPGASKEDTSNMGEQYKIWLLTVNNAIKELIQMGYEPEIKAVFWQQGENDASHIDDAKVYEENLKHLIKRMREDLQKKSINFILGLVMPPPTSAEGRDLVRAAQRKVAQEKNVKLVETDDLSQRADDRNSKYLNDHLHFGTAGTWDLGIRFADCWFLNHK